LGTTTCTIPSLGENQVMKISLRGTALVFPNQCDWQPGQSDFRDSRSKPHQQYGGREHPLQPVQVPLARTIRTLANFPANPTGIFDGGRAGTALGC
jgi:hypothetical protein